MLREAWSPALSSHKVLAALWQSLRDPSGDGGCSHSTFWSIDPVAAMAQARSLTEAHAMSGFLRALVRRDLLWLAPEMATRRVGVRALREMDAQTLTVLSDRIAHGLAIGGALFSSRAILDSAVPTLASLAHAGSDAALRDIVRISPPQARRSVLTAVAALRSWRLPHHAIRAVIIFCVFC